MNVECLKTTDPKIAVEAGLLCTDSEHRLDSYDPEEFLTKLIKAGHLSVIEHLSYSFKITGITRALLQELARHRLISLSVKSTRWALKKFAKKIPHYRPNYVTENKEQLQILKELDDISEHLNFLIIKGSEAGIPNDIMKYYIQESMCVDLMLSLNARELRHMCSLRTSKSALAEFQNLCLKMFESLPSEHRFILQDIFLELHEKRWQC